MSILNYRFHATLISELGKPQKNKAIPLPSDIGTMEERNDHSQGTFKFDVTDPYQFMIRTESRIYLTIKKNRRDFLAVLRIRIRFILDLIKNQPKVREK